MLWNSAVWIAAAGLLGVYAYGQARLARRVPTLAARWRLLFFAVAMLCWAAALAFPLAPLSRSNILARMGQTVLICMVAGPLFWLALPWHTLTSALPPAWRNRLTALCVRPSRVSPLLHALTSPIVVWFFYLSAVLIWNDPLFLAWEMAGVGRQRIALLVLGAAALLFWQQITRSGPRRYSRATPLARGSMLLGVEIPNVIVGISIVFRTTPLYTYYANLPGTSATALQSAYSAQTLSGALTWIFGTLVYVTSIVFVANEVFVREEMVAAHTLSNWDEEGRFIAPGLEDRLDEPGWRSHDWDAM